MKITGPCLGIRQLRCSSWEHKCSLVFRQLLLLCTSSGLLHPVRNNNSELWLTSKAKISLEDFLQLAQRTAGKATPLYACCFKTIWAMQYRLSYIVCLFLVGNSNLFHCLKFGLYFWCGSTFLYAINTGSIVTAHQLSPAGISVQRWSDADRIPCSCHHISPRIKLNHFSRLLPFHKCRISPKSSTVKWEQETAKCRNAKTWDTVNSLFQLPFWESNLPSLCAKQQKNALLFSV